MKNMKRIHKVVVKRMLDTDPDTSWLGEYGREAKSDYAIDRAHSEDCSAIEANHRQAVDTLENAIDHLMQVDGGQDDGAIDLISDAQDAAQECDCSSGHWDNRSYRYFNPNYENYKGDTEENIRKYCRQDFDRMEAYNNQQWCFIGIRAEAEYTVNSVIQEITSGGLWGTESDSDKAHFQSIEEEELAELRKQLAGIGFSKRAISAAFKNIEHESE